MQGFSNVSSAWVDGDLYYYDKNGAEIFHIDGANRRLVIHASAGFVAPLEIDATDIADGAVTSAKLANGAGVAALLAAGLGASVSYIKTKNDTTTVLAADGAKDRAILVVVTVDEVMAAGTGTAPTFSIGETTTGVAAFAPTSAFAGKAAGTVLVFGNKNLATKNITVTGTQAVGNGTGGITVAVLAIPTT